MGLKHDLDSLSNWSVNNLYINLSKTTLLSFTSSKSPIKFSSNKDLNISIKQIGLI
uniref:Uncharacterized protein n=1 Tax=Amphimedon queenslandica TaxID=400682 RepID=A0A1X7VKC5_AMPQE